MRRASLPLILLASLACASCASPATDPGEPLPSGYVRQTLDATGGWVARPAGWIYHQAATQGGWRWTITEQEPAPDGSYATGTTITLYRDVRRRTGTMVRLLAQDLLKSTIDGALWSGVCPAEIVDDYTRGCIDVIEDRAMPSGPLRLREVVVVAWWDALDMVVTVASSAPPERWDGLAPVRHAMQAIEIIGPRPGFQPT